MAGCSKQCVRALSRLTQEGHIIFWQHSIWKVYFQMAGTRIQGIWHQEIGTVSQGNSQQKNFTEELNIILGFRRQIYSFAISERTRQRSITLGFPDQKRLWDSELVIEVFILDRDHSKKQHWVYQLYSQPLQKKQNVIWSTRI